MGVNSAVQGNLWKERGGGGGVPHTRGRQQSRVRGGNKVFEVQVSTMTMLHNQ